MGSQNPTGNSPLPSLRTALPCDDETPAPPFLSLAAVDSELRLSFLAPSTASAGETKRTIKEHGRGHGMARRDLVVTSWFYAPGRSPNSVLTTPRQRRQYFSFYLLSAQALGSWCLLVMKTARELWII
jgi:hypothetical protein